PAAHALLPAHDLDRSADRRRAGPRRGGPHPSHRAGAGGTRLPGGDRGLRLLPDLVLAAPALPGVRLGVVLLLDAALRGARGLARARRAPVRQPRRCRHAGGGGGLTGQPARLRGALTPLRPHSAPIVWTTRSRPSPSRMRTVRPPVSIETSPKVAVPPRLHRERGLRPWSSGRGRPGVAESGPAMNSWKDQSVAGWWRISWAKCTSAVRTTRLRTPRWRRTRRIASRSTAKPVARSSGTP